MQFKIKKQSSLVCNLLAWRAKLSVFCWREYFAAAVSVVVVVVDFSAASYWMAVAVAALFSLPISP